jgi:serine/threonine protein kinase
VVSGLPGLLAERYFEHPRLQQEDARLSAEQQVELIRWEYQQRWQSGGRPWRIDYQAAFPEHAGDLKDLRPRWRCPRCRKVLTVEEEAPTLCCPDCASAPSVPETVRPLAAEEEPPAEGLSGLDLRNYELVERLGEGGMGEVHRTPDPALGRDLAVKVIKAELSHNAEAEHRFLREARITGSLQHPGIVPVYNLGRLSDGRLHYTMRLVRGRTFAEILQENPGKPERLPSLLGIFEKVCQAVAYMHSKGVLHRDLKPANVMVGEFGEVQVMDWGLAKILTPEGAGKPERLRALSRAGRSMGTPAYMPPEQALGEWDQVDERADVFALGAILCEILTGRPAYGGEDGNEVLRRAQRGDLAEARERLERCGADAALTALCRECLAAEQKGRPRHAGVVAERVAEYEAEVQDRLRRAELERAQGQVRRAESERKRRLVALIILVLLLLSLIRNRVDDNLPPLLSGFGLFFHGLVTLITAMLA